MTECETAVLLANYRRQLVAIAETVESELPDDLSEEFEPMIGRPYTIYPVLQPLLNFIDDLDDDINSLRRAGQPEGDGD